MLVLKMVMLIVIFLWMMACNASAKDPAECPGFTRVSPRTEKKVSACPSITGAEQVWSLGECKKLACSKGGNGFEIDLRNMLCRVKKCDPSDDPKLTIHKSWAYAWDVYLIDTGSSEDDSGCSWTLKYPGKANKFANCAPNIVWDDKTRGLSAENCKKLACTQGGNTINFTPSSKYCSIKICDPSDDLKLERADKEVYEIYTRVEQPRCPSFTLASPQSAGKSSGCKTLLCSKEANVEACKKTACDWKANVFNFKGDECCVEKCDSIEDLKLNTVWGGYDVYTVA